MTKRIELVKHHGLGNDFLIAVDPSGRGAVRLPDQRDARAWCDRHTGVGADGLIVATPESGQELTAGICRRWRMTLWNADGGRAETSGNGIRCLGQAIVDHLALDRSSDQELTIETDAGTRQVIVTAAGAEPTVAMVRTGMGKAVDGPPPSSRWSELGIEIVGQRGVEVGNPHLVAFVDVLGSADMAAIGPVIEADYPRGLNVHLVAVRDHNHIDLRVWERGSGVTKACGSGACAAAWASNAAGFTGTTVEVDMPGGAATVELTDDEIFLTGPATAVAEVIVHG